MGFSRGLIATCCKAFKDPVTFLLHFSLVRLKDLTQIGSVISTGSSWVNNAIMWYRGDAAVSSLVYSEA